MTVTIGSVTEGNANAEEIKNNSPDSELYEKNKKYLQGSLVKFNDKIYLAKRNVPSDVDLDNPYYWEIFMDAADSKRVDELFEKTGNLDKLETESKDNLVAAINEVGSIQPDWNQNDETKKDYIKNRTHWVEHNTIIEETAFTIESGNNNCELGEFEATPNSGDILDIVYDEVKYTATMLEHSGVFVAESEICAIVFEPIGDKCKITILGNAGNHTISISQTKYHTIDRKYIKDMYYSEIVEVVVGTGGNGWFNTVRPDGTIPKLRINGIIYENIQNTNTGGNPTYQVGKYQISISPNSGIWTIIPNDISADDLEFLGIDTVYHPVPDEYMPEWVASKDDISTKMDKTNPTGTGSFSMNRKVGTVIGTNSHAEGTSTTASGRYSHAEGSSTTASGYSSHAEGSSTTASGYSSHAEGDSTTASQYFSHAEGENTEASGNSSHAEGSNTEASGGFSHAEGNSTTASGYYSHAEGGNTQASGQNSHAEGSSTTASGYSSHAEGDSTNRFSSVVTTTNPTTDSIITAWKSKKFSVAKGYYSHVEGKDNLALSDYSHAEGYQTIASKKYSHAEGNQTTASGGSSHAEGGYTKAPGSDSHAEGTQTTASGSSSHAEGYLTTASGNYSHAQGKFNIEDTSNIYADIIGNGTSDTARSNAATVDWEGNAWFAGDVYTGSTSGTNKDDGSKKLATEEYVDSSIAANSVLYTAQSLTEEQKVQARANIGAGTPYTLPQATANALGGVKADSAEAADTQPVRIGGDGKLYTAASGGTDISLGLTSAAVGQTIKVKAIDESGKPTAWEAANMPSGGGGHWETVLDTVWEQDVINPTAFDSETGIFTCAEGELNNLELNTEYIFYQQCKKQGVAFNTIINNNMVKVTKLSDTTFSIDVTPPTTFVPTNVKFSKGACLAVTDIDAKKIRLTLDGQFNQTATAYDHPFYGIPTPYFGQNTSYQKILSAYQAYQQVTAEVESPYRIVGEILCGFNAPSTNGNFHFKNNFFCCPLIPYDVPEGNQRTYFLTSDGTKIAKLYSTLYPWHLGTGANNTAISNDYLKIISGTKVKLERWVE